MNRSVNGSINAESFGFSVDASPETNTDALQKAVDKSGLIRVDTPGVYDISGPVVIGGNTALEFAPGVVLRRKNTVVHTFINRGSLTGSFDENIRISGLNLSVNDCEIKSPVQNCDIQSSLARMPAHIAFDHVKNLIIEGLTCMDLMAKGYCLQICAFENIKIENLRIEGAKDAIHLGPGKGFVIRDCVMRTFDDPIALNAHDYFFSSPQFGWIENGVIENCYDLNQPSTTGFFCRFNVGSWIDWRENMPIKRGNIVAHAGNLYAAGTPMDNEARISKTPPTHLRGTVEHDGIAWYWFNRDTGVRNAGVRNVHFKNIFLNKQRDRAFSITGDNDKWSNAVYPGSDMPIVSDIVLENIVIGNKIGCLLEMRMPGDNIKIVNSTLKDTSILLNSWPYLEGKHPTARLLLSGTTFIGKMRFIAESKRSAVIKITGSMPPNGTEIIQCSGDIRLNSDVKSETIDKVL